MSRTLEVGRRLALLKPILNDIKRLLVEIGPDEYRRFLENEFAGYMAPDITDDEARQMLGFARRLIVEHLNGRNENNSVNFRIPAFQDFQRNLLEDTCLEGACNIQKRGGKIFAFNQGQNKYSMGSR